MRNKLTNEFIEDFWKWFDEYHKKRYKKENKNLSPVYKYHSRNMNFDNYAWDWVAIFVREQYIKKKEGGET